MFVCTLILMKFILSNHNKKSSSISPLFCNRNLRIVLEIEIFKILLLLKVMTLENMLCSLLLVVSNLHARCFRFCTLRKFARKYACKCLCMGAETFLPGKVFCVTDKLLASIYTEILNILPVLHVNYLINSVPASRQVSQPFDIFCDLLFK